VDLFVSDLTSQLSIDEAYHEGQRRHIAFTPVNSAASVARDPHLAARSYFAELDHPGAGRLRYPGAPYRHTETPWAMRGPAPGVGQHNEEIYGGELGLTAESLQALERDGII
jgi:crotonobetainyl-CoA:carnitine CoA-transferase CaiB-like acyl-CoA transferase